MQEQLDVTENPQSVELIYQNECGVRAEILEDRHRIKQGYQSNLTVSAVLLGLLLNMVQTPASANWNVWVVVQLGIATGLLIVSAILSLVFQFTSRQPAGYVDSAVLYNDYAAQDPLELRRFQLANLIGIRKRTLSELYKLSCWANVDRGLIVASVLLVGAALLTDLFTRIL